MKRIKMIMIALMMAIVTSASAMTYDQAKQQALFLADKMAYELNLTEDQYEAAYEINLDYLMAVNDYDDLYGTYWTRRNLEFQSILASWQYDEYVAATYFYRPVYWSDNTWNWRIYSYYPVTTWYNSRPAVYVNYRGGNSRTYYTSRTWSQPSQRIVRANVQTVRTASREPAVNRTFGNLSRQSVSRTNNVNVTNINVNNNRSNTVFRAPANNVNRSVNSQATGNRSFGSGNRMGATSSAAGNAVSSGSFGGHR